jgi:amino acid transporter
VTARDSPTLEQFGYRQELKRSLGLVPLVVYGLVMISPTSPISLFGIVFNLSHGMVPLVYIVGFIAMGFTALSYVTMSRAFPIAGSVYAYAGRGIGAGAGFIAGWGMLLDYVLMPALVYVLCAIAIQAIFPGVPRAVSIVVILGFNTTINLVGIEATARLNAFWLAVTLAFLTLFLVLAIIALTHGVAGAHLSLAPLWQPKVIEPGAIFASLAVATLCFLGFDGISTLVEEARGGAAPVGRATLLSLCLATLIFVTVTYLASLFVLERTAFAPGEPTDGAIYGICETIGGPWFKFIASSKVLFAGAAVAAASQVATARLLFSMARDGRMPRALAHVHATRRVPDRAILLVGAINLAVGVVLANELQLLTSMVNFGALSGFLMLHASVIVHFAWRQRSRDWLRHLLAPLIGFAIIAYVLFSMALPAKIAGSAWLLIGAAVFYVLKAGVRYPAPTLAAALALLAAAAATMLLASSSETTAAGAAAQRPVVQTVEGRLLRLEHDGIDIFTDIPYAESLRRAAWRLRL